MSKRKSGILAVSYRCSSLHLLFSFFLYRDNCRASLIAYNPSSVAVFAETVMFLLSKSCIHKRNDLFTATRRAGNVRKLRRRFLTMFDATRHLPLSPRRWDESPGGS